MKWRRKNSSARFHKADRSYFRSVLLGWQNSSMTRFSALRQFQLYHFDFRPRGVIPKCFGRKSSLLIPCAEVASSYLPDYIAAMPEVIRAKASFTGVMGKSSDLSARIQCFNRMATKGAKAHSRNVQYARFVRLLAVLVAY